MGAPDDIAAAFGGAGDGPFIEKVIDSAWRDSLGADSLEALCNCIEDSIKSSYADYRTMVLVAVLSGLRRGEIFGLKWKCIDWIEGSILVSESSYEGHVAAPKTKASRRLAFVDDAVLESLRSLRPAMYQPNDLVFCTDRGTPLNPNNVLNRVLHPTCKSVGLPRVSWHNFRYTYSTWANPTGESIKALQAQLGHTDSRLTLSVYTQPMPEAQKKMAGKIARVLLPDVPRLEMEGQTEGGLIQ